MKTLLIVLLLVIAGCLPSMPAYRVESTYDRFQAISRDEMLNNIIGGYDFERSTVTVNAGRHLIENQTRFSLEIRYSGKDWLFLNYSSREPVSFMIDGDVIDIPSAGGKYSSEVGNSGYVREQWILPVDHALIKKLGSALSVAIRLYGRDYYVERDFNNENMSRFAEFATQYQ